MCVQFEDVQEEVWYFSGNCFPPILTNLKTFCSDVRMKRRNSSGNEGIRPVFKVIY